MKTASLMVRTVVRRRTFRSHAGLLSLTFLWVLTTLSAKGVTFDYESVTDASTSFTSSGQTWTLTGYMANVFATGFGAPAAGTASPASDHYMDTGYFTSRGLGNVGGIKAPVGYVFRATSFDVWPSSNSGNLVYGGTDSQLGTVGLNYTMIGKKNNSPVVSANVTDTARSPAQTGVVPGGYWHHIDLSSTAFATTDIDTIEFVLVSQTGLPIDYLAVDNFVYSNFRALVATTTTVSGSPNPSTYGQSVTFTATVTRSAGTATPSGTVTFKEGAATLGTGALSGSGASATATYSRSDLSVGNHTITAEYAGDATFSASSGSTLPVQAVNKASSTITVTGTTSFTYSGSAQGPDTADVTGSGGAVTYSYAGTGGTTYGPSATKPTAAGAYSVTATVAADANYNGASSSATAFTIGKATPGVTTWPTASAITYGQTLADSTLSGGVASVAGSFDFTTPSTAPGVGTALQGVTFTPTDTANYNTVRGSASVTVNATGHAPVAVNDTLGTVKNQAVSLPAAKLAANDTDEDGDPLTVIAISTPSTMGGTVVLALGTVTYTPASEYTGADSFTYTMSDGHGNTAIGTVNVTITSSTGVSLNRVYGPVVDGGNFVVRFAGIPGRTYTLEYTDSLTQPVIWQKAVNLTAPTTAGSWGRGVFQFSEPTGGASVRYYRTTYPAY
jgi:hypothetical protein